MLLRWGVRTQAHEAAASSERFCPEWGTIATWRGPRFGSSLVLRTQAATVGSVLRAGVAENSLLRVTRLAVATAHRPH
jgi:hypothetical protein